MSKQYRNNAAVKASIQNGTDHYVGQATYRGANPVYEELTTPDGKSTFIRIAKGVPFVKIS